MNAKLVSYIKSELSKLADFDIGNALQARDVALGEGIYEYDDQNHGVNLKVFDRGVKYESRQLNFTFNYDDLIEVDKLLTLPEVARLNGNQLIDELVSFEVRGKGFCEEIKVPFKVYVRFAPLMVYLGKNKN